MRSKSLFIHVPVKSLRTTSSALIVEVCLAYNILHIIHCMTIIYLQVRQTFNIKAEDLDLTDLTDTRI